MSPFFDPWLGRVDPLVLDSTSQLPPGSATRDHSPLYFQEFEEVRVYGVKDRPPGNETQEETALFFSDIASAPIQAALRDLAMRRGLDISDRARLFAAVDMSLADTSFAVSGRQVLLRMVRLDHRDPRGGYGRQSRYDRRFGLDLAHRHTALSGLAERPERDHRCPQHRPHAGGRRG